MGSPYGDFIPMGEGEKDLLKEKDLLSNLPPQNPLSALERFSGRVLEDSNFWPL